MDIKEKLKFEEPSGNVPTGICHLCGKKSVPKYCVDLNPFESGNGMLLFMCSDECCEKLLALPNLEIAIASMIMHIAGVQGERLNDEFENWINSL